VFKFCWHRACSLGRKCRVSVASLPITAGCWQHELLHVSTSTTRSDDTRGEARRSRGWPALRPDLDLAAGVICMCWNLLDYIGTDRVPFLSNSMARAASPRLSHLYKRLHSTTTKLFPINLNSCHTAALESTACKWDFERIWPLE
jgi:hypothetical protein